MIVPKYVSLQTYLNTPKYVFLQIHMNTPKYLSLQTHTNAPTYVSLHTHMKASTGRCIPTQEDTETDARGKWHSDLVLLPFILKALLHVEACFRVGC